jgi:hypothetical protein
MNKGDRWNIEKSEGKLTLAGLKYGRTFTKGEYDIKI